MTVGSHTLVWGYCAPVFPWPNCMHLSKKTPLAGLAMLLLAGCSPWLRTPIDDNVLPAPLLTPETVVLEIAFVHLAANERDVEEALWQQIDEQTVPVEIRRELSSNGLRVGLAGTQLPQELRSLVQRTAKSLETAHAAEDLATAESAGLARQRRLQMRAGRRGKVVVTTTRTLLSVLARDAEGRVQGKSYRDAQCLFGLKGFPQGDGRTQIQLTPEIEHGELKNNWVPIDGALVQQVGKQREVYENLIVELNLSPGQTMVLGATQPACGIGQHFFTTDEPVQQRTLLLVRVAQTQLDDLFQAPAATSELSSLTE